MKKQPLKDRVADLEREAFEFRRLANAKGYATITEALEAAPNAAGAAA